jgi:putative ABC transport system permease protein
MTVTLRVIIAAKSELLANKGRSIITAGCIAVAIAAFAIIMQLGGSAQRGVDDTVERTQGRAGTVRMTASGAPLRVLLHAARASGEGSAKRKLTTAWGRRLSISDVPFGVDDMGDRPSIVGLQAVDSGIVGVLPASIAHGRWFTEADSRSLALPVVLGPSVSREISQVAGIDPAKLVGRTLVTNRPTLVRMRVVGIIKDGPLVRFLDGGNVGFVPLYADGVHQALAPYQKSPESVDLFALFGVSAGNDGTELKTSAQRTLFGAGQYSAEINTDRVDRADDFAEASRALATLLSAIGAIALLIGIIGVTNVNLMAVRERTREFGLRRALGSGPGLISGLVMAETVMVILVGGVIGVVVAAVLSWIASSYLASMLSGVPIGPMTLTTAAIALGASAACGLLAGFIPAWRAHRTTVIQAIRN